MLLHAHHMGKIDHCEEHLLPHLEDAKLNFALVDNFFKKDAKRFFAAWPIQQQQFGSHFWATFWLNRTAEALSLLSDNFDGKAPWWSRNIKKSDLDQKGLSRFFIQMFEFENSLRLNASQENISFVFAEYFFGG